MLCSIDRGDVRTEYHYRPDGKIDKLIQFADTWHVLGIAQAEATVGSTITRRAVSPISTIPAMRW